VVVADREMVESQADVILQGAADLDVAFLVVGDPFGATTHTGGRARVFVCVCVCVGGGGGGLCACACLGP
jgi:hypothetical protein